MRKWNKPELWELSIEKTAANIGGTGNDQWMPDFLENPIEGIIGDFFGRKS